MKKPGTNNGTPKSFEEVLRQKLDEVDASPKNSQWERLEANLDQLEQFRQPNRKVYYSMVAAFLLLFIAGSIFIYKPLNLSEQTGLAKVETAPLTGDLEPGNAGADMKQQPGSETSPELALQTQKQVGPSGTLHAGNQPSETAPGKLNPSAKQNIKPGQAEQPDKNQLASVTLGASAEQEESRNTIGRATRYREEAKNGEPELPVKISASKFQQPLVIASADAKSKNSNEINKQAETTGKPSGAANHGLEVRQVVSAKDGSAKQEAPSEISGKPAEAGTIMLESLPEKAATPALAKANNQNNQDSGSANPKKEELQQQKQAALAASDLKSVPDSLKNSLQQPAVATALPASDSTGEAEQDKKPVKSLFSVGLYAGPTFFNQNIKLTESGMVRTDLSPADPLFSEALQEFDEKTRAGFSYHGGMTIGKEIIKGLKVETGLGYSHLAAATTTRFMLADVTAVSVNGVTDYENHRPLLTGLLSEPEHNQGSRVVSVAEHTVQYTYKYLQIPLQLQVYHDSRKWRYFAAAGAGISRLLQNSISAEQPSAQALNKAPRAKQLFRPWLWSGLLSAGIGYHLSENLMVQGSGQMNVYFSPVTAEDEILEVRQEAPEAYQVSVGVTYTFLRK